MQWIRKRLLEILCVMIYFTVNPLSTSGLRPLRLSHLLSVPNSRSTEENNKASNGARQSQKKMMDPLGPTLFSGGNSAILTWGGGGGPQIGEVTCIAAHST